MTDEATEQTEDGNKTVEFQGKRVKVFEYTLPVSGDKIAIREVGIFTSRKIEEAAGVTTEESSDKDRPVFGKLYEKRDDLFKMFIPDLVVEPADFNQKKYTEDDLMDIIIAVFARGKTRIGLGGAVAGRTFPEKSTGGGAGAAGKADEQAGK